jgi:pentatricopeptide repeat protein
MIQCPQNFREWPDEVLYNCMIDMCVRYRALEAALDLFYKMKA